MLAKETGCLARSSRAICFAVARSQVIKFPLSTGEDTSFLFAWGAFIARFHIEKRGYGRKDLARSLFELLRRYLLGDLDAGFEQIRARFFYEIRRMFLSVYRYLLSFNTITIVTYSAVMSFSALMAVI